MARIPRSLLIVLGAAAGAVGAAVVAERRLSRAVDALEDPEGWTTPVFPAGRTHQLPTDDGATLVVGETGPPDGPPVLLVHGITSSQEDWGPVASRLVDRGRRVLALNQRGHGGSTAGSQRYSAERFGQDVATVIEALDLHHVTLVGHSMGGIAAMGLFASRPELARERLARLVLVATVARGDRRDHRLAAKLVFGSARPDAELLERHGAAFTRGAFGRTPTRAMVDAALTSAGRCPPETRIGAITGLATYDLRATLPSITVPTVVICGSRDWLTPLYENRRIAAAIPGARMEVIPGAGHLVIWEEPGRLAELIAA